jgi:membrane associated rhomboid family serine protease
MGIYDRSYYREEPRRGGYGHWSAVTTLIVINVAVFVADMFAPLVQIRDPITGMPIVLPLHWLDYHMGLMSNFFTHPWSVWELVTYGFAHDPQNLMHILFNMLGLWMFGQDVEAIYGRTTFYRVYFSLLVLSGLAWLVIIQFSHLPFPVPLIGASGAVMGIVFLYILHFPQRTLIVLFFPMPAWVAGIVFIGLDLYGAMGGGSLFGEQNVANTAHLAGVFFGFVFYRTRWTLFSLLPSGQWIKSLFGPKLRVHRDADETRSSEPPRRQENLQQRVDQILAKISREGEASLTSDERRTLEEASRNLRDRRG